MKSNDLISVTMITLIVLITGRSFAGNAPPASPTVSNQSNVENSMPFSLTISGGISLGSYEAGVNWTLLDYLRKIRDDEQYKGAKPELTTITGASAGAINAVMTAMLWCVDKEKVPLVGENGLQNENSLDDNILRNAWVTVGIDDLMPPSEEAYCNPGTECKDSDQRETTLENKMVDELFTRRAFKKSETMIRSLLNSRAFLKNKRIDIAILATRETPLDIEAGGIKVKSQRYVFLLQFETDNEGNGRFTSNAVEVDPRAGTFVYLPQRKTGGVEEVDPDEVIRLMYASSAFPVAFGRVNLRYCTDQPEGNNKGTGGCPANMTPASSDFIDGGVFDNVPLGAALSLREARVNSLNIKEEARGRETAKNYFFFISPSKRRNVVEHTPSSKPRTFGMNGLRGFVPGFLAAAADHELYTVLRTGQWQSYDYKSNETNKDKEEQEKKLKLVATDRYFPITGAFLGHFGAFLDQPFREFDYGAGVYDTANDLAKFMKFLETGKPSDEVDGREVKNIYDRLGLKKGKPSSKVFTLIAKKEHCKEDPDPASGWHWIKDQSVDTNDSMSVIFNSIIETMQIPLIDDDGTKAFNEFIKRLNANNYLKHDGHSDVVKWIIKRYDEDYTVWYAPLVSRVGKRLLKLQKLEGDITRERIPKVIVGVASLGLDRFFDYQKDDFIFMPNTVPQDEKAPRRDKYYWIPYELGTDTANGGVSISYLARIGLPWPKCSIDSIDLKGTPAGYNKFGDDRRGFSQVDIYFSANKYQNLYSFGLGPTVNYLWNQADEYHRVNIGTALYVEILQTLRFTAGLRDNNAHNLLGHNYYFTLGLVDLPGLLYRITNKL